MSRFFKGLLGVVILTSTIGLATCQSLVKAETKPISILAAKNNLTISKDDANRL